MKLGIGQIILEHAEFKHRDDYLSLEAGTPVPQSEVNINFHCHRPDEDRSLFVLRLTVTSAEDGYYQFTATYALFGSIEWQPGEEEPADMDRRLMVTGGNMLFPFIRELVANLTSRGRFGASWVAPADFSNLETRRALSANAAE